MERNKRAGEVKLKEMLDVGDKSREYREYPRRIQVKSKQYRFDG